MVDALRVMLRPGRHVYAHGRLGQLSAHEILINGLAQEWHEGRDQAIDSLDAFIKRHICGELVLAAFRLPEPAPIRADVPVTQAVYEGLDGSAGAQSIVVIERLRNTPHGLLE